VLLRLVHNLTIKEPKTIIVGMSGGVDSSVCAALLKEQGHNVIGLFMKNWEELDDNGECTATKDFEDVAKVCEKIDIPYYSVEFIKEYRDHVFKHFVDEYQAGYTPNPDILCNREIKFKVFFDKAMEMGADYLATGHYCQHMITGEQSQLVKGVDPGKDQTYFLYTMQESILNKVLFPIGHLEKSEVRALAKKYDLATQEKKDSTGICFIGERNFREFLSRYVELEPGDFVDLAGKVVGKHTGSAYYTIGQRKGLGLGGAGEAWFVVSKNIKENTVCVVRGEGHPALYSDDLWATELSFVDFVPANETLPMKLFAKVRYRQPDQECILESIDKDGRAHVTFSKPQKAITPRQSIVFYRDQEGERVCLGGAMIEKSGATYYEQGRDLP
jgi:tRNA-specific 2-thiouridylase